MKHPIPTPPVRRAILVMVSIHAGIIAGLLTGCGRNPASSPVTRTESVANENFPPPVNPLQNEPARQETPPATNALVENAPSPMTVFTPAPMVHTNPPPSTARQYTVIKGDTLHKIARSSGVSFSALLRANPEIDPAKLKAGQKIRIPSPAASSAGAGFKEPTKPGESAATGGGNIHVVKAGETLTRIAQQHNCTVKAIQAANGQKTTRLLVGQKLRIPAASQPAVSAASPKTNLVSGISADSKGPVNR